MEVIKVLNWEKFNPRKDRVRHHWFRVDNDIPFSKTLFGFEPDQKWLWICLLALASKSGKNEIELNEKYLAAHTGLKPSRLRQTIEAFKLHSMISITSPLGNQSGTNGPLHNITDNTLQTDNTDITDITVSSDVEIHDQRLQQDSAFQFFQNIKQIRPAVTTAWLQAYDADWILSEMMKAKIWCVSNPKKAPKQSAQFLSNWFSRGWEKHRKGLQSKSVTRADLEESA